MSTGNRLWRGLEDLGLPDPTKVQGRMIVFSSEDEHVIFGTIISLGYGPTEGVSFRVSSPRFCGHDVEKIVPREGGDATLHATDGEKFSGSFELF